MTFETLVEYLLMADQEGRNNEAIRLTLAEKEWENIDELRDGMRQFEEAGSPRMIPSGSRCRLRTSGTATRLMLKSSA